MHCACARVRVTAVQDWLGEPTNSSYWYTCWRAVAAGSSGFVWQRVVTTCRYSCMSVRLLPSATCPATHLRAVHVINHLRQTSPDMTSCNLWNVHGKRWCLCLGKQRKPCLSSLQPVWFFKTGNKDQRNVTKIFQLSTLGNQTPVCCSQFSLVLNVFGLLCVIFCFTLQLFFLSIFTHAISKSSFQTSHIH